MSFLDLFTGSDSVLNFKLNNQASLPQLPPEDRLDSSAFKRVLVSGPSPTHPDGKTQSDSSMTQIMEERQRLINQYLQLNIQMLEKEINEKKKTPQVVASLAQEREQPQKGEEMKVEVESNKKKIKKTNSCGHDDRVHYAKGLCSNCYHRYGRVKKPWRCSHEKLYAGGMCQNCYINDYNRKRREEVSKVEGSKEPVSPSSSLLQSESAKQKDADILNQ